MVMGWPRQNGAGKQQAGTVRSQVPHLWVYYVEIQGRMRQVVSLIPPEHASRHGIPPRATIGQAPPDAAAITPESFIPNPAFKELLQRTVGRYGPLVPALQAAARTQGEGWVYVIDDRRPVPQASVPPADIIGVFEVRGGVVVPETYQGNRDHLLLSDLGFLRLDPWLHERLVEEARQLTPVAPSESGSAPADTSPLPPRSKRPWWRIW